MKSVNLGGHLNKSPRNGKFYTIAVDGRGASGKSSLLEYLIELLPGYTALNGDDYFEPLENQSAWGDFNDDRFSKDIIEPLKQSTSFTYRPYDWHAEPHIAETLIQVRRGFILERCYSFEFELDWDVKIWVEAPKELCLVRALKREAMPRERVIEVWENVWQPREDEYIARVNPAEAADIVLDGAIPFKEQLK